MGKALLTDGLLSAFPAADACSADLCVVGKLLTVPALCLPVSAEKVSVAPVQKQGVVVQNVLHRDAVKGGELVRQIRREAAVKCTDFQMERQKTKILWQKNCSKVSSTRYPSRYRVVRWYEQGRG